MIEVSWLSKLQCTTQFSSFLIALRIAMVISSIRRTSV